MKIVAAIDSFKGSLTSIEAGQTASDCIQSLFPNCQAELIPIADGGEGMLAVMMSTSKGHIQSLEAHNHYPPGRHRDLRGPSPCTGTYAS